MVSRSQLMTDDWQWPDSSAQVETSQPLAPQTLGEPGSPVKRDEGMNGKSSLALEMSETDSCELARAQLDKGYVKEACNADLFEYCDRIHKRNLFQVALLRLHTTRSIVAAVSYLSHCAHLLTETVAQSQHYGSRKG